jgi:hypothetical protein
LVPGEAHSGTENAEGEPRVSRTLQDEGFLAFALNRCGTEKPLTGGAGEFGFSEFGSANDIRATDLSVNTPCR